MNKQKLFHYKNWLLINMKAVQKTVCIYAFMFVWSFYLNFCMHFKQTSNLFIIISHKNTLSSIEYMIQLHDILFLLYHYYYSTCCFEVNISQWIALLCFSILFVSCHTDIYIFSVFWFSLQCPDCVNIGMKHHRLYFKGNHN